MINYKGTRRKQRRPSSPSELDKEIRQKFNNKRKN